MLTARKQKIDTTIDSSRRPELRPGHRLQDVEFVDDVLT